MLGICVEHHLSLHFNNFIFSQGLYTNLTCIIPKSLPLITPHRYSPKKMALLLPPAHSLRPLTLTTLNPTTTSLSLLSVLSPFPSLSLPSLRFSSHHHLSNRSLRFLPSVHAATSAATSGTKPTVIVTEKLGEAGLDFLREFANVDCAYNLSQEELCAKISLCDAIIVRSGTKVLVLNEILFFVHIFLSSF